ncbi:uroporphyrinogen-III synthase [Aquibacillus saliphilus]|uniref:uroporphyrinogen-III synthase n=1 Tax=Aquibacillus saliphilus TaxID=1909422 RepID=UPI001CF067BF|nr:uroporphyrinogen-III synthase [Aquibacillus saliphilus]
MSELKGKQIGIAADKQADAIGIIISDKGGNPVIKSIQGKRLLNKKSAEQDVNHLIENRFDWVILTTGIGAEALEHAAKRLGRKNEFIEALRQANLAIRGNKTNNWLEKWGLKPTFLTPGGTMTELLEYLDGHEISGNQFFFQAYNKDEQDVVNQIAALPVTLYHSMPYFYLPPDEAIVEDLRTLVTDKTLDAIVFTSKTQVQNLFLNEAEKSDLIEAFGTDVLAVAIGQVTADELKKHGVERVLESNNSKLGAMIITLADYYEQQSSI